MRHKRAGDKRLMANARNDKEIKPFRRERTPPQSRQEQKFIPYVAQKGERFTGERIGYLALVLLSQK